jgi:hypothetical protein
LSDVQIAISRRAATMASVMEKLSFSSPAADSLVGNVFAKTQSNSFVAAFIGGINIWTFLATLLVMAIAYDQSEHIRDAIVPASFPLACGASCFHWKKRRADHIPVFSHVQCE